MTGMPMIQTRSSKNRKSPSIELRGWGTLLVALLFGLAAVQDIRAAETKKSAAKPTTGADLIIENGSSAVVSVLIRHYGPDTERENLGIRLKIPYSGEQTEKTVGTASFGANAVFPQALRPGRNIIYLRPIGEYSDKPPKSFEVHIKPQEGGWNVYSRTFSVRDEDFGIAESEKTSEPPPGTTEANERARVLLRQLEAMKEAIKARAGQVPCDRASSKFSRHEFALRALRSELLAARNSMPPLSRLEAISKRVGDAMRRARLSRGFLKDGVRISEGLSRSLCAAAAADGEPQSADLLSELREILRKQDSKAGAWLAGIKKEHRVLLAARSSLKELLSAHAATSRDELLAKTKSYKDRYKEIETEAQKRLDKFNTEKDNIRAIHTIKFTAKRLLATIKSTVASDASVPPENMEKSVGTDLYLKGRELLSEIETVASNVDHCRSQTLIEVFTLFRLFKESSGFLETFERSALASNRATNLVGTEIDWILREAEADANAIAKAAGAAERCKPADKDEGDRTAADETEEDKAEGDGKVPGKPPVGADREKPADADTAGTGDDGKPPASPTREPRTAAPGPDKTGPDDGDKPKVKTAACDAEKSKVDEASAQIASGALATADARLNGVDIARCPDLAPLVSNNREIIQGLVDRLVAQGQAALDACNLKDPSRDRIRSLPPSPKRDALIAAWDRAYATERDARALIHEAITLNKGGQLKEAAAKLRAAQSVPPYCPDTRTRLVSAIATIEGRIADAGAARIREMVTACNFRESRPLIESLPKGPRRAALVALWNRFRRDEIEARKLIRTALSLNETGQTERARSRLREARGRARCESTIAKIGSIGTGIRKAETAANQSCSDAFGRAHAVMRKSGYKTYVCECDTGYRWNDTSKTRCVRVTGCEEYGTGYRLGPVQSDGKAYCIPDQATADAWCNQNSKGSGWYAVNINDKGTYSCRLSPAGANAWCAGLHPRGGWSVRQQRDGSWTCHGPRKRVARPRGGRRRGGCPKGYVLSKTGKCVTLGQILFGTLKDAPYLGR